MDVAYQDVHKEVDSVWCVKGLMVTSSNLVVTWTVRPWMCIIFLSPLSLLVLPRFFQSGFTFSLQVIPFNLGQEEEEEEEMPFYLYILSYT